MFSIEPDRLRKVNNGLAGNARTHVRVTSVVVPFRRHPIEPNGLGKVSDGFIEIALVAQYDSSTTVRLGIVRVRVEWPRNQSATELSYSRLRCHRTVHVRFDIFGIQLGRLREVADRLFKVAHIRIYAEPRLSYVSACFRIEPDRLSRQSRRWPLPGSPVRRHYALPPVVVRVG